jgi:hypothetical protein
MDYSKIDLNEADKFSKTLSGSEFEIKTWKDMEDGEQWIKQMLFVGAKKVKTANGDTNILQFQHPQKLELKRCVWTNTILNNAIDSGDLEQKDYLLYTITYGGLKEKKSGKGKPYHAVEIGCTDLRKLGYKSLESESTKAILEKTHEESKQNMNGNDKIESLDDAINSFV